MKCWRCGADGDESVVKCPSCGADLMRKEPTSEIGKAMRMLYDRYGAEKILTNSAYLVNGLGDLTEDSKKVRNQMKMAMDAGMGRAYLEQIALGAPDASFDARVRMLLTDEAGLSDKTSAELAGYFNEMIGWKGVPSGQTAKAQETNRKPEKDFGLEIDRRRGVKASGETAPVKKKGINARGKVFAVLALCIIAVVMMAKISKDAQIKEQELLKARFETNLGNRGALTEDDLIVFNNSSVEEFANYESLAYKDLKHKSMSSCTYNITREVFGRGLTSETDRAKVKELYGEPVEWGKITKNSEIYQTNIKEYGDDWATENLGKTYLIYELKTSPVTYKLMLYFEETTNKFCGFTLYYER